MRMLLVLSLLLAISFFVNGCAPCTDCGAMRESHEATRIFTSEKVLPNHNYFYNGEILFPKAILAIDNSYSVQGKFWTPIDITQEQLSKWINYTRTAPPDFDASASYKYEGRFQGAQILNPDGEQVGVWYSKLDWGVFKFPEENVILVYPPSVRPGSEFLRVRDR
ncbi:MAG: hypothetical protein HKP41_19815 [Desulfobacterales bacterium]|nr:hypothetical protein [Deltaproteobacteria bacterium]NNK96601.1 hypothetical protein [Desulfobacterales bacterium]